MPRTLNLVNQEQSDIKYHISKFPDGQQDVTILSDIYHTNSPVVIRSRFSNFGDLEIITAATKAIRKLGCKELYLFIPYLLGARSDRQFYGNNTNIVNIVAPHLIVKNIPTVEGSGTSYLRDVVAPGINALNFDGVVCVDVHSDVATACINNLVTIPNHFLVQRFIHDHYGTLNYKDRFVIVSPDGGSLKKIYGVAEAIQFDGEIIVCNKHRDIKTGKILSTEVPISDNSLVFGNGKTKDYIIIDDICDGGRTFTEIAKILRQKGVTGKIILIITHAIFSAGLQVIADGLDIAVSTNSFSDIEIPEEKKEEWAGKFIQFDIF